MKSVVCYLMVLYLSLTRVPSPESQSKPQLPDQPTESVESSKSLQSLMINNQNSVVKSDSQSVIDSVLPLGETDHTEMEYPIQSNVEKLPSALAFRRQSQQTDEVSLPHF